MNNFTIVTKLRIAAAIAPAILLAAGFIIAGGFHFFGAAPRAMYDNDFAAARAAAEMDSALHEIEWGRGRPDGAQIVLGQERRFAEALAAARLHSVSPGQIAQLHKIAAAGAPIMDAIRAAAPGDEAIDAKIRDLLGMVADLMGANGAATMAFTARAESQAKEMIAITIVCAIVLPWLCFAATWRLGGRLYAELKAMRALLGEITERAPDADGKLAAIGQHLAQLGFPKPNPMLAE